MPRGNGRLEPQVLGQVAPHRAPNWLDARRARRPPAKPSARPEDQEDAALALSAGDLDQEDPDQDGGTAVEAAPPADEAPKGQVSTTSVALLVCGHALSAAMLLVVNKWAQKVFPFVWTLTTLQFSFATALVYVSGRCGLLEVERLELKKLVQFFPAAGMFFITITAGNAVVGRTNVDTFIVMRSVVPIPAALLETFLLGEPLPRPRSMVGLVVIILGAIGYSRSNLALVSGALAWVVLFLVLSPVDAVIIRHIVRKSGLSPWTLVLYNNVCAVLPGTLFSLLLEFRLAEDREAMGLALRLPKVQVPLLLSCCIGVSISYFQLNVRGLISSAAFMVLGVSNKFLSVAAAQLASRRLDANGDFLSLGSTLVSIAGGILFQQTVKGKGIAQAKKTDFEPSVAWSFALVVLGILAAAAISFLQTRPQAFSPESPAPPSAHPQGAG